MVEIQKECEHDECGHAGYIAALVMNNLLEFPEHIDEMALTSPIPGYPQHFAFLVRRSK